VERDRKRGEGTAMEYLVDGCSKPWNWEVQAIWIPRDEKLSRKPPTFFDGGEERFSEFT
jgi:hypothetical protein